MSAMPVVENRKATMIAFINNKGGSTKTTTVVNIAGAISRMYPEKKVLIVEGDGQGNASTSFKIDSSKFEFTIYDVFMGNATMKDCITNAYMNIDIISANTDMNFLEFDVMDRFEKAQNKNIFNLIKMFAANGVDMDKLTYEQFVKAKPKELSPTSNYFNMLDGRMDEISKEYDVVLFDTPPELKAVTSSILAVSDKAIIPFEPDTYAIDGIVNILSRIKSIQEEYNPNLDIAGILAAKVKKNTKLHSDIRNGIMMYCMKHNINYFQSEIPNSIRFASATAYQGLPGTLAKQENVFVKSYYDLLHEMVDLNILPWAAKEVDE